MKGNMNKLAVLVAGVFLISPVLSFAEEKAAPKPEGNGGFIQQAPGQKRMNKEELLKLKKENPEKFKALMRERREQAHKRLEALKQSDPERYRKVMSRIHQRRIERMERLKKENPGKFKELMEKRKASIEARLEKLKTEDPQKYQRIMERRKKMQEFREHKKQQQGMPAVKS